jgi:putative ABC transport system permease protein
MPVTVSGIRSRSSGALLAFLAARNLAANRSTLVLLTAAVAVGAGFQIPNAANLAGYTAALVEHGISSGSGDVRVRPKRGAVFVDGDAVAARASVVAGVGAVVPVLMLPGSLGGAAAAGTQRQHLSLPVAGVDPGGARAPYRLVRGAPLASGDDGGVLLGASAASELGVDVGDRVSLRVILGSAGRRLMLDDQRVGRYELVVRGVVAGAFGTLDPVFVDRAFLGREAGMPGAASALFVYAPVGANRATHDAAAGLAARVAAALPEATATAWGDDAPFLRASIHASDVVGDLSQSMVFLAVAVPVMALLTISALGRRRQTALLAAMGFGRGEIWAAALLEAVLVGLLGSVAGVAIGLGAIAYFERHPVFVWHAFVMRPALSPGLLVRSAGLAMAATVAGAVYPTWRAATLDPARVLREVD